MRHLLIIQFSVFKNFAKFLCTTHYSNFRALYSKTEKWVFNVNDFFEWGIEQMKLNENDLRLFSIY